MTETIQLGDIVIAVTRKDVKHVHLSVHPPSGRVTLVALEPKIGVEVAGYFLQRMKTKWGGCNPERGTSA